MPRDGQHWPQGGLSMDLYGAKKSAAIAAKIIADCDRRIAESKKLREA